ncbi:MAG: acyl-CoA dehydrogenase family protein [Candidatus Lambdaproteobacteria bacterium]|nr:acyl-CoA dehydrogenase family protein [Candidatus Lambdaproteobacteria bacterium]
MDMREPAEIVSFRKEVRDWVKANYPYEKADPYNYAGHERHGKDSVWFGKLGRKGWLAFRWPVEWGGSGFTPPQQLVYVDELVKAGADVPRGFGITMIGPLLFQFGTDAQKRRFLPAIARNEEIWCQGYSEPNAGSDLASLQTKAELRGDHFLVNGQKIWTSGAGIADWIFCLVRTRSEGKRQQGISFLLIDMKSPGLSIKPIKQIDGGSGFYETHFDEVKVPADQIVGKINEGWTMAKALLGHERAGASHIDLGQLAQRIRTIARQHALDGGTVMDDSEFRMRLAGLEMDADCMQYTRYRLNTAVMQGKAPGHESSIMKVFQSETLQKMFDLGLEAMGPDAMAWYDKRLPPEEYAVVMQMCYGRATSIFSGSNEIQRNIMAKRVLGLPGD